MYVVDCSPHLLSNTNGVLRALAKVTLLFSGNSTRQTPKTVTGFSAAV